MNGSGPRYRLHLRALWRGARVGINFRVEIGPAEARLR